VMTPMHNSATDRWLQMLGWTLQFFHWRSECRQLSSSHRDEKNAWSATLTAHAHVHHSVGRSTRGGTHVCNFEASSGRITHVSQLQLQLQLELPFQSSISTRHSEFQTFPLHPGQPGEEREIEIDHRWPPPHQIQIR